MGCVALLPADLASQIAAGEVVERPASALKELLENAVDAGATRCAVEIEGGGITRLSVLDNGCGMNRADAALSFQRHATSKLVHVTDLERLTSYGFRGEALPSIASVSRLTMRTRTADQTAGTELNFEGGLSPRIQSVGCAVGTLVEVKDLFFNVPARRKFLRSTGTESGHLTEIVEAVALCRPHLALTLRRDGRSVRSWHRAEDRQERVRQSFDAPLVRCCGQRGPVSVEAFLSSAHRARNGAAGLKILVNERPIKDRALAVAVAQAYGDQLERGRYPRGVIYLNLPPALVDFNVHPQKLELRFAEPRAVCDALFQVLRTSLPQALALAGPDNASPRSGEAPTTRARSDTSPSPWHLQQAAMPTSASPPWRGRPGSPRVAPGPSASNWTRPQTSSALPHSTRSSVDPCNPVPPDPTAPNDRDASYPVKSAKAPDTPTKLQCVGVAKQRYILCESANELVVLDFPATYEFAVLRSLTEALTGPALLSQALLFPSQVPVSNEGRAVLARSKPLLDGLGMDFRLSQDNPQLISVHGLPEVLGVLAPELVVATLLSHLLPCPPEQLDEPEDDALLEALEHLAQLVGTRQPRPIAAAEAAELLARLQAHSTDPRESLPKHCIVGIQPWPELNEASR